MRTEGGQDDDVAVVDGGEVLFGRVGRILLDELDVHLVQVVIHLGVVDQLIGDVNSLVRKVLDGLVGQSD